MDSDPSGDQFAFIATDTGWIIKVKNADGPPLGSAQGNSLTATTVIDGSTFPLGGGQFIGQFSTIMTG